MKKRKHAFSKKPFLNTALSESIIDMQPYEKHNPECREDKHEEYSHEDVGEYVLKKISGVELGITKLVDNERSSKSARLSNCYNQAFYQYK
jgi:hypothetical protein